MEKIEANEAIAGWARVVKNIMLQRVASLTLKDKRSIQKRMQFHKVNDVKTISKSLGFGLKREYGAVVRVNFKFVKHAIYFEHGVGKGRRVRTSAANPHPFLARSIDPQINELADIIANYHSDAAIREIKFFIPGIIDKRVKIVNYG